MHFKFLSTLGKRLSVLGAATLALTITACGGASSGTSITNTVWSASMMKNTAQASDQTGEPFRLNGRSAASVFSDSKVAELANAACDGAATRVKPLVQAGADVNGQGTQGITPLIWAMSCHNYAGISALLEQGANPNLPMANGSTAVYLAAGGSDPKILPLLLDHGGNPKEMKVFDLINNRHVYKSPLMNAAQMDRFENVKLLVTRGANVYYIEGPIPGCPFCGLTPLDVSKAEIAVYLIRHSPDNKVRLQSYADDWYEYSQLTSEEQRKRAPDDYQTIAELLQLLAERGVVPKDHNGIAPPPSGSSEPQTKKDANQAKLDAFLKQREAEGKPCANGRAKLGTDGAPRCARLDPGAISATEWHQVKALSGVATQAGNKAPALYVFFDPNCPPCAQLWQSRVSGKPFGDVPAVWIPVAYYSADSLGKAAAILRQGDRAALERNFGAGYNVTKESGGITPVQPTRAESRHIAESRALWKDLGGGTPMLVFQTANGKRIRFMGFPQNHLSTLETIVQSLKQPKSKQPKLTPYKP
jgi:hypothetical protein